MKSQKGKVITPLVDRFWAMVDKRADDECWLWLGQKRQGYGSIYDKGRRRKATQVSWEIHNGQPFPEGKLACHTCDNPPCVNPRHIWPGTMSENIKDAIAKGRTVPASKRPGWKTWNATKTHCIRGHELSGDNLVRHKSGRRNCRACRKIHDAKYDAKETP